MSDAAAAVEPATDSYPARLDVDYPEEGLGRASTLLRIVMVIPIAVVAGLLTGSFVGNWQVECWGISTPSDRFGPNATKTAVVASTHSSLHSPLQYSRIHRRYIFALDVSLLLHTKGGWLYPAT